MVENQILRPGYFLHQGSYRIESVLGQGGFGITYLATDVHLSRRVAIKEFFPKDYCERTGDTSHVTLGNKNNRDFIERLRLKFLKESRNIASLNHPGIIRILSAFEENGTAYYVMDYIEGESLQQLVKRRGPLPVAEALDYIRKVGDALDYLHSRRMNHLDVKPANIMVGRGSNQPILIDFGLAKQYDQEGNQTSTTPTGISHGYAPMEQYRQDGVGSFSPATDLYSLAATLYYLLTGSVPPQAPSLVDTPLTFPANFPQHLIAPIRRAMSIGKFQRHGSVGEFIAEISQTPGGVPPRMPGNQGRADYTVIDVTHPQGPSAGGVPPTAPPPMSNPASAMPPSDPKPQYNQPVPPSGGARKGLSGGIIALIVGAVVLFIILIVVLLAAGGSDTDYTDDTIAIDSEERETAVIVEEELTDTDIANIASNIKNNVSVSSQWADDGWGVDDENSGKCHVTVTNTNNVAIDGSDYYVTFKYEYMYGEGANEYSETVTKPGVTLQPGESAKIYHFYTDDCSPLKPTVNFKLTDNQIFTKYAR